MKLEDMKFADGRPWFIVDEETGCWIWQGDKMRGYGRIRVGKRSSVQAQRHVWSLFRGDPPRSLDVGHTCLRRSCVNPDHMELQTKEQNDADRYKMPTLGATTRAAVEEAILDDKPHGFICMEFGISHWSIRRLAEEIRFKDQFKLSLDPVPF